MAIIALSSRTGRPLYNIHCETRSEEYDREGGQSPPLFFFFFLSFFLRNILGGLRAM